MPQLRGCWTEMVDVRLYKESTCDAACVKTIRPCVKQALKLSTQAVTTTISTAALRLARREDINEDGRNYLRSFAQASRTAVGHFAAAPSSIVGNYDYNYGVR